MGTLQHYLREQFHVLVYPLRGLGSNHRASRCSGQRPRYAYFNSKSLGAGCRDKI